MKFWEVLSSNVRENGFFVIAESQLPRSKSSRRTLQRQPQQRRNHGRSMGMMVLRRNSSNAVISGLLRINFSDNKTPALIQSRYFSLADLHIYCSVFHADSHGAIRFFIKMCVGRTTVVWSFEKLDVEKNS